MTGEMSYCDIETGGEHHGWAVMIRKAAQSLARRTRFAIRLVGVRPFDVYQGPYAQLNTGTLWCGEVEREFFYDAGRFHWKGTVEEIAAAINSRKHN